jgi:hypothetical protein
MWSEQLPPLLLHRSQSSQLRLRDIDGVFRYPTLLLDLPGLFPGLAMEVDNIGHRTKASKYTKVVRG